MSGGTRKRRRQTLKRQERTQDMEENSEDGNMLRANAKVLHKGLSSITKEICELKLKSKK